jgi:hypothetical protein
MKTPLYALLGGSIAFAGCASPEFEHNHWHINSVSGRIGYHVFGYESQRGGYLGQVMDDQRHSLLTLRRHLLNDNPDNPLLPQPTPAPYRPEPPDVEFSLASKQ